MYLIKKINESNAVFMDVSEFRGDCYAHLRKYYKPNANSHWKETRYGFAFSQLQWYEFTEIIIPIVSKHVNEATQLYQEFETSEVFVTVKQFKREQYITFKKEKVDRKGKATYTTVSLSPHQWDNVKRLVPQITSRMGIH